MEPSPETWTPDLQRRSPAAQERIIAAERFAAEHHHGQYRNSGDPFIVHPRAVAEICLALNLDSDTVCAALLHDTVEDTDAQLEEIATLFGPEISALVDGVTKISGLNFRRSDDKQAENYRKMIVAMADDIRVVLIKLADRLHNMRTIGAQSRDKQQKKAQETLQIYAPLAHRLGINKIKWELEDLSFNALHPRKYQEIKTLVGEQRQERQKLVDQAASELREVLQEYQLDAEVSGRPKHFYSIYRKMSEKGREFNEIFDLIALRVIVEQQNDCYVVNGIVHDLWTALPGRYKDYISVPKANGYQALHTTVLGPAGQPLEIQIRSQAMHRQAEYGVAAHVNYKENRASNDLDIPWVERLAQEQDSQESGEFLEALKTDLFEDEIYVFTPGGDIKRLARGSTPIDFAYAVHTDIGHSCAGAKVNGRLVPLHYKLQSGDRVEVLTSSKSPGPSRDWLKLAGSRRAREKIRSWFRRQSDQESELRGREMLLSELKSLRLPSSGQPYRRLVKELAVEQGLETSQQLFIALGRKKLSVGKILEQHLPAVDQPSSPASEGSAGRIRQQEAGIVVAGQKNVAVRLANCCHPAPGDQLLGYISRGRGVTVHRQQCPNAAALNKDPQRLADVSWEHHGSQALRVEIEVRAADRRHLLEDISRVLSESGADIISASCLSSAPVVENRFVIEIGDRQQLQNCLQLLRQLPSVLSAQRRWADQ